MSRVLVLLLLLVTSLTPKPAAAGLTQCVFIERIYGVDYAGDLILQPFCSRSAGGTFQEPRKLASFGAQVPLLFHGEQLADTTVIIYGVGNDGALRWYKENSVTGRLDPGVVIGSQFGDWRGIHDLKAIGGELSGVDGQGLLWRWRHTGWEDGADTWAPDSPQLVGSVCPLTRPIFVGYHEPQLYVGYSTWKSGYVYCWPTGTARVVSELPPGMREVTMAAGPGVTYAVRETDGRLIRLVLDRQVTPALWRIDTVARTHFSAVFTGKTTLADGSAPPYKYEWQWAWYGD